MLKFKIIGLYLIPEVIEATDEAEARRKWHDKYPDFNGAIWSVQPA